MARRKKKDSNPSLSMEQLINKAVELFQEPYDDRDERDADLPSLRAVADQLDTTILRTRKILITAGYYSTETSRLVQELEAEGKTETEIMEITRLRRASVNSYLPYRKLAFNLDQKTANADRHRLFRRRMKAVEELQRHMDLPDASLFLWKAIIAFEKYPFKTSGRGSQEGVRFTYTVSRSSGAGVDGFGNDIWIVESGEKREKRISRSTVETGYRKARDLGTVRGPKELGLPGAESYLWPIFLRLGVCQA